MSIQELEQTIKYLRWECETLRNSVITTPQGDYRAWLETMFWESRDLLSARQAELADRQARIEGYRKAHAYAVLGRLA